MPAAKPSPLTSDEVPITRGMLADVWTELKSEIHELKAGIARIEALLEEQKAQTRIVLDGITALLSRQDQVEQRVVQVEDTVRKLAAGPPRAEPEHHIRFGAQGGLTGWRAGELEGAQRLTAGTWRSAHTPPHRTRWACPPPRRGTPRSPDHTRTRTRRTRRPGSAAPLR